MSEYTPDQANEIIYHGRHTSESIQTPDTGLDGMRTLSGERVSRFQVRGRESEILVNAPYGQVLLADMLRDGELHQDEGGAVWLPGERRGGPAQTAPSGLSPSSAPLEDATAASEAEPVESAPEPEWLAGPAESLLSEATEATSEQVVYAAANFIADGGTIDENMLGSLARGLGVDPAEAQDRVDRISEAFRQQAAETIARLGVDPEAAFEWARENDQAGLAQAIRQQVHDRSTAGYKALAQSYLMSLDQIDPEAILSATFGEGISAFRAGNGAVVIQTPDGEQLSWRQAVEFGVIRVGGA
jgi:hypothetical protein